jgi:hypothetical protein
MKTLINIFIFTSFIACSIAEKRPENLGVVGDYEMIRTQLEIPLDAGSLPKYAIYSAFEKGQRHLFYGFNSQSRALDIFDLKKQTIRGHLSLAQLESELNFKVEQVYVFSEIDIFLYGSSKLIRVNGNGHLKEYHNLDESYSLDQGKSKPELSGYFQLEYLPKQDSVLFHKKFDSKKDFETHNAVAQYKLSTRTWEDLPIRHPEILSEIENLPLDLIQVTKALNNDSDTIYFGFLYDTALAKFDTHTQEQTFAYPKIRFSPDSSFSLKQATDNKEILRAFQLMNPQFFMALPTENEFIYRPYWKAMDIENAKNSDFTEKGLYLNILSQTLEPLADFPLEPYRYGINTWFAASNGIYLQNDHPLNNGKEGYFIADKIMVRANTR